MIDLHSHILPGVDDGTADSAAALELARAFVDDGVLVVACTPHILPGLYHNRGPEILIAVSNLQAALNERDIPLVLVSGADNHITPDFIDGLSSGRLLALHASRYVLVEPPHHSAPPLMEEFFANVLANGYVPILTHPERLSWIREKYALVERLVQQGVWMQITAGSLTGAYGTTAQYWAERMLDEGLVHILASDAHDTSHRPPNLTAGREAAARRVGFEEAENLVFLRPRGILENVAPSELPQPIGLRVNDARPKLVDGVSLRSSRLAGGLRRLFA